MDHIRILRRAFNITLNYRVLWVFGIILALTTGSARGGLSNSGYRFNSNNFARPGGSFTFPNFPQVATNTIIGVILSLVCIFILIGIGFAILRYVSETALIRMVNMNEDQGEKVSFRQGFRLGWSRGAWRIFLINLLFTVGFLLAILLMLVIVLAPLLLLVTHNQALGAIGVLVTVGLGLLMIFVIIVAAVVLSVVNQFFYRSAVLEDRGVYDSIRRGFGLVQKKLGDVAVMALILFGLSLAFGIVMIPVVILLVLVGLLLGGLPALLVGFIVSLFVQGAAPWIIGLVVGLPIFFLVIAAPTLFIGGLVETFKSSTWTLVYREVIALEAGSGEPVIPPASPEPTLPVLPENDIPAEGSAQE